ncbi:hypothetical protein OZ411_37340 [Bradyrhizobium sp. Arg237L]|uniref:antibiotic biosynthesis monooxygenase family protein n=1 Tax=Bradyrhizobium sp. Arg237L TaxID=3003352 RepID=UPI00249F5A1E|nr:hypothetical protein [Bradyrhizobium sp. Arg237L]MDI4238472.1 hypothetical protein [Bradyrhizobium sp. Arg237L]
MPETAGSSPDNGLKRNVYCTSVEFLDTAKMLRSDLEQVEGFVDNIRYRSFQREGWILFLSGWRDEKSLVRWRTG